MNSHIVIYIIIIIVVGFCIALISVILDTPGTPTNTYRLYMTDLLIHNNADDMNEPIHP